MGAESESGVSLWKFLILVFSLISLQIQIFNNINITIKKSNFENNMSDYRRKLQHVGDQEGSNTNGKKDKKIGDQGEPGGYDDS